MAKNKNRGGRPSKYKKKYAAELIEFFSTPPQEKFLKKEIIKSNGTVEREYVAMAARLPTFSKFARHIGVDTDTLLEWGTKLLKSGKPKYEEFSGAYKRAKELQRDFLVDNGLAGLTPPASFIFVATNITDMRNKQDLDHTSGGKPLSVGVVSYVEAARQLEEKKKQSLVPAKP